MERVYNFSAGPACLPLAVLEKAGREITNYNGSGMSVMEMSHRTPVYEEVIRNTEKLLRQVMSIPDNYKVLFLQGGASLQFASIPMNLLNNSKKADYVVTGQFSGNAYEEAKKYGDIRLLASSKDKNFTYIPEFSASDVTSDADYVHICYNNTIFGSAYDKIPDTGNIPLVADVSSCILSRPIDVSKFGLLYAGAQKNMGPSGLTVVIVRDDLIGNARKDIPKIMDYKVQADNESMVNTPPCYSIYIMKLVLEWLESEIGGLEKMERINLDKAAMLYDCIDNSKLFSNPVEKKYRSIMNATFVTGNTDLDKKFCKEAEKVGIFTIAGHRSVGGMRASIYNAMPIEGVKTLVEFMKKFESEN